MSERKAALVTGSTSGIGLAVATALEEVGYPVTVLRAHREFSAGRRYVATTRAGETLNVLVIDRDLEGAGVAANIWRTLRVRDDSAPSRLSMRRRLERTALQAYASQAAGAPTPELLAAVQVDEDAALLAFRDADDELIGAELCSWADDVLLISRKGQAIRFAASDEQLRPMGRATSGVTGMKFRGDDALLSMAVIDADMPEDDRFVFTVTDGGFAKRTAVSEYRQQGRGGLGIKAMKLNDDRGSLVGGLVVQENDEIMAIKTSGQIIRSSVSEVPPKGRDTMGVKFVHVQGDDSVSVIALYPESGAEVENGADGEESTQGAVSDTVPPSDTVGPDAVDSDGGDPQHPVD